ncbi:UDP-N-acetylmuramoyl-L-alanine--D-glutamate ligase [Rhodoblastus acidophilus]|uniref:UDP-N-acetylmuramoylalanine--D-glutamate ligase n=1 Tax=Candidatus Rhodoblastus alkanivorans TaxID=2954117 RepID=A0ABS9Z8E5_9HYPH|nr:UDP-N-acetylmuramoyl-L-alanine--D-glutamate ligase [Candidatus Rhodoblastus alkanivorans]MCI4679520.1 UDP-N-acetylmuramoyl-L-alanine--D-glutamate ligase [Candidatus Rhodoblastus alkanivorans]MCI4683965.1 UDP-N-acetylmuramoyl-L-alanine--D-glutamate ligase [Candidatus Rhodoblastus alkanivorans]MDI4641284.1 UDP-N-acetylmuramoyl-L-alanine--D-glutamate ligase [Rhodoblastus acidophilus]
MIPITYLAGQSVALFGLGGSGLATAKALVAGGAFVNAWDDSPAALDKASAEGIHLFDLHQADWSAFVALILAPGAPLTHPEPHWSAALASAAGVPIIGDIELFCRERAHVSPGAPMIAITGTNGKSTTTALIAHILRDAGIDVQLGGNIGTPILDLEPLSLERVQDRVYVVECSSFQIDLAPSLNPSVGVLLNLTPDHLDRHGTMENYATIKQRLVEASDFAVVGRDDDWCEAIFQYLKRAGHSVVGIANSRPNALASVCYEAGRLRRAFALPGLKTLEENLFDLARAPALRGAHNGQNAAAAFAACERLGLAHDEIGLGMRGFPGLAHRMEQIGRKGKVLFVNDSKATNADAAEKALESFDDIFWIAGGKAKAGGIDSLRPLFGKIAKAFLIGEAAPAFAATLEGAVACEQCGTLDAAVAAAARDAAASDAPEPVVLLSPACASYDQFANFEQRGDAFREQVLGLLAEDAVQGALF